MTSRELDKKCNKLIREMQKLPKGTLYIKHGKAYTAFVQYLKQGKAQNINRNTDLIYSLARKKYLSLYLPVLKGEPRTELDKLLLNYKSAGLNIARITMSSTQYAWMKGKYKTNPFRPQDKKYSSNSGVLTRSKSEREITNQYEWFGIPMRYEAALTVDLSQLVSSLEKYTANFRAGKALFHYSSGQCVWNVPLELSWMNMHGSLWRGMDPQTFTTTIYPDFTTKTYDDSLIYHEHEGVADNPFYRCTASDRVFVLRETGAVLEENLITTFEQDLADSQKIKRILETRILPRI